MLWYHLSVLRLKELSIYQEIMEMSFFNKNSPLQ
jgi:hypothetical protein